MKLKNDIRILAFLFFITLAVNAQKEIIHGKITAFNSISIGSAEVSVKKTKLLVFSDSLGYFSIECAIKDKISIKAAGFKTKYVKVKSLKDSLNINLVVVGKEEGIELAMSKGHINKKNLALAKKQLNTKQPYYLGFTTMTELILGKFPGRVSIVNNQLILRGRTSLGEENRDGALIMINGSDYNWAQVKNMAIANIKNIRILNSLEASKYGAGAGNGVVIIKFMGK